MRSNRAKRGNAVIEFTLVGIPIIFVLISIVEVARGMWIYSTLAHAVREGTRYAIVHGQNCATAPNQCQATVAMIAARIRDGGAGLIPADLTVTLENASGGVVMSSVGPTTLANLLTNNTVFPAGAGAAPGNDVVIRASYPFSSAIALFWPGAGPGMVFPTFNLPAISRDKIQF